MCCEPMEAPPLFEEAERNNVLLFTALNRRHDPQIIAAKAKLESGEMGRPLSVSTPPTRGCVGFKTNGGLACVRLSYLFFFVFPQVSLLSGDYPYPPEHYLRTCGTLYQDCAIHDFDYVTCALQKERHARRAKQVCSPV